jgi:hypothetical protein
MTTPLDELSSLSSDELDSRMQRMIATERAGLVEFLWHLAEVERRHLDNALGYESAFAYCNQRLHMSKASCYRRTTASRLLVRFPVAAEFLADGRLCLTTLVELREVLTDKNVLEVLHVASGRTEDEVKLLAVTLRPKPDVTDSFRKVPVRPVEVRAFLRIPEGPSAPAAPVVVVPPPKPPSIEPLNAERFALRMSVGPDFKQRLEEVKSALSHVVPDGNLEGVMMECMRLALEACTKRRQGAKSARSAHPEPAGSLRSEVASTGPVPMEALGSEVASTGPVPMEALGSEVASTGPVPGVSRHVRVAVNRAVWERDGGRCAFVGLGGRRCNSRHQLEVHHVEPFARGGEATVENLMLVCRRHNEHCARLDFGEDHMARFKKTG